MTPFRHHFYFVAFVIIAAVIVASTELVFAETAPDGKLPSPLRDTDYLYNGAPPEALFELGRNLFFDPILSGNRNISCGTCHDPAFASGDGLALGIGEGGKGAGSQRFTANAVTGRVPRNAQPLWNIGAKQYVSMFHDGRVEMLRTSSGEGFLRTPAGEALPDGIPNALTAQAFFPVASPIEMAGQFGENTVADAAAFEDREKVWSILAERVASIPAYFNMLAAAFEDLEAPADVEFIHIAKALAAFQSMAFRSDNAPFDRVLQTGDVSHLSAKAQWGMSLFFGKAGCAGCHKGPLFTDHRFHAIGMPQVGPGKGHGSDLGYFHQTALPGRQEDEGRYRVTFDDEDLFAFRTPSLRNVAKTGPWGHSGAFDTLEAVIRHHLNPRASLLEFDAADVEFPELQSVIRLAGRGSHLGFTALEPERRADFNLRDTRVMRTAKLKARLSEAARIEPIELTDADVDSLIAFLEALTDPDIGQADTLIPDSVPSGLKPQPAR